MRGQASWVDIVCPGLGFKVSIIDLYGGNITGHELAVFLSTADVEVWVYDDLLNWKNDVIVFLGVGGGVPFTANNFCIIPRHQNSLGVGSTVLFVSAETGAHVRTATVGNRLALLIFATVNTVGTCH